jgi:hypothetical protein
MGDIIVFTVDPYSPFTAFLAEGIHQFSVWVGVGQIIGGRTGNKTDHYHEYD